MNIPELEYTVYNLDDKFYVEISEGRNGEVAIKVFQSYVAALSVIPKDAKVVRDQTREARLIKEAALREARLKNDGDALKMPVYADVQKQNNIIRIHSTKLLAVLVGRRQDGTFDTIEQADEDHVIRRNRLGQEFYYLKEM